MPALPQSNNLQEIQRAFLELYGDVMRAVGGQSTTTQVRLNVGGKVKTGVAAPSSGTGGSTVTPPTVTTPVKGRMYASVATIALSQGETDWVELNLTESADIISIKTNIPAWVRIYNNAASREADQTRALRTDPTPGTGLMTEVLTFDPDGLLIYLSPVPFWNNCDEELGKTAYLAVTRASFGTAEEVVVDIEFLPQEDLDHGGPQGKPGSVGPSGISILWAGEWDEDTDYLQHQAVGRMGGSYVCVAPCTGVDPATVPTPPEWGVLALRGEDGTDGTNGTNGTNGVGVPAGGATGQALFKKSSTDYDTEWQTPSSSGGGTPSDYISGLVPTWVSSTSVSVTPGKAYIESSSSVLSSTSTITKSSLSLTASTWHHLYLYNNSGTPDVEISTTGPNSTAFSGTARSKNTDTSKRYIGSIRTDASGNVLPFEAISRGNALETNHNIRLVDGATGEQTVTSIDASTALFSESVDYLLMSFTLQSQAVFVTVKIHTDNGITTRAQCNHQEGFGLSGYTAYGDYVFPRPMKRTPGSTTLYWWRRTWSGTTGGALYIDVQAIGIVR